MIAGAGHMTRYRIDRFDVAAKTFRSARIEHSPIGTLDQFGKSCGRYNHFVIRMADEFRWAQHRDFRCRRQTGCLPGFESAVEHGDCSMPEPTQQPPKSR